MANYSQTSNPNDFDDVVDWSENGRLPTMDIDPKRVNPFFSKNGISVIVSHKIDYGDGPIELLRRVNQSRNEGDTEFPGQFEPGAKLLSTVEGINDYPLTLDFDRPIAGVGVHLMGGTDGQAFTGILRVYDSTKQDAEPVGECEGSGVAGYSKTLTAPFLGIVGDTANIVRVKLDTVQDDQWGFVINSLRLLANSTTSRSSSRSPKRGRRNGR